MRLTIPSIGTKVKLTADWTFDLFQESRNEKLYEAFGLKYRAWGNSDKFEIVKLSAGTVLKVDRIYIKKGASEFDSISFYIDETANKALKKKRFWAKLHDVNNIECEFIEETVRR